MSRAVVVLLGWLVLIAWIVMMLILGEHCHAGMGHTGASHVAHCAGTSCLGAACGRQSLWQPPGHALGLALFADHLLACF